MTTGITAVSAESSFLQATAISTSLVPVERRLARRGPSRASDGQAQSRISVLEPVSDGRAQIETLHSAFISDGDAALAEKLDVAGQYWFYATLMTANYYPTVNVWA
jgi:hypothetical protein